MSADDRSASDECERGAGVNCAEGGEWRMPATNVWRDRGREGEIFSPKVKNQRALAALPPIQHVLDGNHLTCSY